MIRNSIMNTEEKVEKLEEKVDDIKEDTRSINKTLLDMNKAMRFTDEQQIYIILGINAILIIILVALTVSQLR